MKNHHSLRRSSKRWYAIVLFFISTLSIVFSSPISSTKSFLADWYSQKDGATWKWFGLEAPLKTYGWKLKGDMKEAYFGQTSGGLPNQPTSNWCFDMKLRFTWEPEAILPSLK